MKLLARMHDDRVCTETEVLRQQQQVRYLHVRVHTGAIKKIATRVYPLDFFAPNRLDIRAKSRAMKWVITFSGPAC